MILVLWCLAVMALDLVVASVPALAVEFAVVGARAAGMGGAGVAVTSDAYATYWNPAGLAMSKTVDIRLGVSAQAADRLGVKQTVNDIQDFQPSDTSAANLAKANDIAARINKPGATVSAIGAAGLYVKGYFGEHAFGFNVSDVATSGVFVSRPAQVTQGAGTISIEGQMALNGLEARQAVASYAYAFLDGLFSIGVSGKVIQGAAYSGTATLTGGTDVTLSDSFGKAKTSTAFGLDVGAMYRPSSWLRMGIVAKDLNRPSFGAPSGATFHLDPQVRGGVAVNPWETLTVTADLDVTKNRTLTPDVKSQVFSVGAEQTIFSELLSLRIGAFKNTADANATITPTAGLGLRLWALRMEVGGGYDFKESSAIVSGTVAMVF